MVRTISGDDTYERYLEHWYKHHSDKSGQPLYCKTFFATEQIRK